MPPIDTNAIIIKSTDSGETSRRLSFFSPNEGRFSLTARGAKSKSGRAHANLEPYTIARVFANLKPEADLGTLSRAETIERFPHLREDLTRLAAAAVVCEVIDRGTQPRLANARLYEYAVSFMRALDAEDGAKLIFLLGHALMRASQALGVAPHVSACVGCGAAVKRGWLDFEAGGLLCPQCRPGGSPSGASLDPSVAALLAACAIRPWSQIREAANDGPETKALATTLIRWLSYHLECEFKSIRFLLSAEKL